MGEIAEMILEGAMCQECGEYLGAGGGFPTVCAGCRERGRIEERKAKGKIQVQKVSCPICQKRVKLIGVVNHLRDSHGVDGDRVRISVAVIGEGKTV